MSTRNASAFSILSMPVARAVRVLLALKTTWERRRVIGQLGGLDEHMLRDIGITRQDVLSVLAEPLYRDPSEKLAERAQETRRASRAAARALPLLLNEAEQIAATASYAADVRRAA